VTTVLLGLSIIILENWSRAKPLRPTRNLNTFVGAHSNAQEHTIVKLIVSPTFGISYIALHLVGPVQHADHFLSKLVAQR
jgi:hypothetical protein